MGLRNSVGFFVSLVKTVMFADLTLLSLPGSNSSILAILQRHLEVPCLSCLVRLFFGSVLDGFGFLQKASELRLRPTIGKLS